MLNDKSLASLIKGELSLALPKLNFFKFSQTRWIIMTEKVYLWVWVEIAQNEFVFPPDNIQLQESENVFWTNIDEWFRCLRWHQAEDGRVSHRQTVHFCHFILGQWLTKKRSRDTLDIERWMFVEETTGNTHTPENSGSVH